MKKILFTGLFLVSILQFTFSQIVQPFSTTGTNNNNCSAVFWRTEGAVSYVDNATINLCTGVDFYFTPICVAFWDFAGVELDAPTSVGTITAIDYPNFAPFHYKINFSLPGTYRVKAYYRFNSGLPSYERTINFKVGSVSGASTFAFIGNNLCPSPLTNFTISRTQPNNTLNGYEIKLYEMVGNSPSLRWTSGYQSGSMTSATISAAQYNGFVAGKTYRVDLYAEPQTTGTCSGTNSTFSSLFTINNTPIKANFTPSGGSKVNDFYQIRLCEPTTPITVTNTSTVPICAPITGVRFRYRQLLYGYCDGAPDIYGEVMVPSATTFLPPANSYNLRSLIPNMGSGGYFTVDMQVQTALGVSAWTARQCIQTIAPAAGIANFGFSGSAQADSYGVPVCGSAPEQETAPATLGGSCNNTDGWLSNGGTVTNPTWVGALYTKIDGLAFSNFTGGVASYRIQFFDQGSPGVPVGTLSGTGAYTTATNINLFPNALNYFADAVYADIHSFDGKIFRVEVAATDVCGNEYKKTGYFRIIPANLVAPCPKCRTANQQEFADLAAVNLSNSTNILSLSPNPVTTNLAISFYGDDDTATYQILSLEGRVMTSKQINTAKGDNTFEVNVNDLSSGCYLFNITTSQSTTTKKFIKID